MKTRRKDKVNFLPAIESAATAIVDSLEPPILDRRERESLIRRIVKFRSDGKPVKKVIPLDTLLSRREIEFGENLKFYYSMLTGETKILVDAIQNDIKELSSKTKKFESKINEIYSSVEEDESRIYDGYNVVHHNSFTRSKEIMNRLEDLDIQEDPKSTINFFESNLCKVERNIGISLPLLKREEVKYSRIEFMSETNKVIRRGKLKSKFKGQRYFILKEHRKILPNMNMKRHVPVEISLEYEMPHLINSLSFTSNSGSQIRIESVGFYDNVGFYQEIEFYQKEDSGSYEIIFDTRLIYKLVVKLYQKTSMGYSSLEDNKYNALVNSTLESIGFIQRLPKSKKYEGLLYDLSLSNIRTELKVYNPLGIYQGRTLEVERPVGITFEVNKERLMAQTGGFSYGLSELTGDVNIESYLYIKSFGDNKELLFESLVPLIDGKYNQVELSPIWESKAQLKLFPNLRARLETSSITYTYVSSRNYNINFDTAPTEVVDATVGTWNMNDGNLVILGVIGHELGNGIRRWKKLTSTSIRVQTFEGDYTDTSSSTEDQLPLPTAVFKDSQENAPLEVEYGGQDLEIGTDYLISIDGGETWYDKFPYEKVLEIKPVDFFGECSIKILRPTYGAVCKLSYMPLKNQFLNKERSCRLKNGRIVFPNYKNNSIVQVSPVFIIRAEDRSSFNTPILKEYFLKVRTNE